MPSTPMTLTQSHNGVARQAHTATERAVQTWQRGAKTITVPVDLVSTLPTVDLTRPVQQYFAYTLKAVELNRDLVTAWTDTVMSLFGVLREHAEKVSHIVKDETETVADLAREQAEKVEQAAREQAERVEQAKQEQAREAKRVEREEAKKAQQQAREAFEGLTKAELSDQLAERGLPKTGNVEELIERLVSADSE